MGEGIQSLDAQSHRSLFAGAVGGERTGRAVGAETIVGVENAAHQRSLGESGALDQAGQGFHGSRDRLVVDGPGGFGDDRRRSVTEEGGDLVAFEFAHRQQDAHADRGVGMAGVVHQCIDVVGPQQGGHAGVTQVRVLVGVVGQKTEDRGNGFTPAQLAQGDRAQGSGVRVGVAGEADQCLVRAAVAGIAQHGRRNGADLRLRIGQEGDQPLERFHPSARGARIPLGPGDLSHAPEAVHPGLKRLARQSRLEQRLVIQTSRQLELRTEADPVVGVIQPLRQLAGGALGEAFRQEGLRLPDQIGLGMARVREAVDPPLAHGFPAVEPIQHPERTVGSPMAVGGVDRPDELLVVDDLEAGSLGLVLEFPEAGTAGAAAEITQGEGVVPLGAAAGALVMAHAAGTGGDVLDGRGQVGRLGVVLRMPHLLGVPRTARVGGAAALEELPSDAPTAVASFDQPGPTGLIAAVGVVVTGEEVAPRIEDEVLRIAQPLVDHLEARTIGLAAEDRSAVRCSHGAPFGLDHRGAVADREVQPTVRSEDQPVQIVSEKADTDPVAVADAAPVVGEAITVGIAEPPDIGDVGEEHLVAPREHPGGDTVERGGEILGEHRGYRGLARALGIAQQADPLGVGVVAGHLIRLEMPLHHGQSVIDRLAGQVFVEPVHDAADVGHTAPGPEAFGDEDPAVIGHIEGHPVRHVRFGCPEFSLPAGRVGEPLDGPFGLVRGGGDRRRFERGLLRPQLVLGVGRNGGGGGSQCEGGQATAQGGGRNRHKVLEGMSVYG